MPWIESHSDMWNHHKTRTLCRILGITKVEAVGHLMSLWHFVLDNAWRDADLSSWGDDGIEEAARWEGKQGDFVKAARDAGFLDGSVVWGWLERAGKLIQDRIYNEERRKNASLRRKTDATLPNTTLPNSTLHNPTVKNRYIIPPSLDAVKAYCLERGNSIDPQQFMDYNEARGWKLGKSKMRDWQATIRTWEKNQSGNRQTGGIKRVVGAAAPVPGKYDHLG